MNLRLLYIGNKLSAHGSTPTGIEVLGPKLESEGHSVVYASSKKNKAARFFDMLSSVCKNRTVDYVLIDTYSTQNFWYAFSVAALCRFFHLKYIPILHGGNLPYRLKNSPVASRFVFKHSYVNVAPSYYLKDAFELHGFEVKFVPNPVDVAPFGFRERLSASAKLLWVRALTPLANPRMAIETVHILKGKYSEAKLCMVGPDKAGMLEPLKNFSQTMIVDVRFTGKLLKEQWMDLAQSHDIFINTSKVDNAPFSLIEAMSLGMFVVSTNVGGISYLVADGLDALLVNDDDAPAMAAAVERIISDKELRTRLSENMQMTIKRFQWQNVKDQWAEILK